MLVGMLALRYVIIALSPLRWFVTIGSSGHYASLWTVAIGPSLRLARRHSGGWAMRSSPGAWISMESQLNFEPIVPQDFALINTTQYLMQTNKSQQNVLSGIPGVVCIPLRLRSIAGGSRFQSCHAALRRLRARLDLRRTRAFC